MSGRNTQRRGISEISHLFLSAVRDRQRGGAAPPCRTPPPSAGHADITPQELTQVTGRQSDAAEPPDAAHGVRAVVAWHLGERVLDSAKRYARNLAATGRRVAMAFVDVGELRLFTFDAGGDQAVEPAPGPLPYLDVRAIRDAIGELRCDADCWLVVPGSMRAPEARQLVGRVERWVVLTTSDAEGVVNCYKALKGAVRPPMPRMSVAVLDAAGPAEAEAVFRRLAGACLQFLNLPLEAEPLLGDAFHVTECQALCCRADRDRTQTGLVAHFDVVARCLELKDSDTQDRPPAAADAAAPAPPGEQQTPAETAPAQVAPVAADSPPPRMVPMDRDDIAEVIELPGDAAEQSVLEAVVRHAAGGIVQCPAHPPACPSCCLAVGRDRRMILLAAGGRDLANLRHILRAWRWADENRQLLAMAMPQLAIDTSRPPLLQLLVEENRADLSSVAGLFGSDNVAVRFYRRVRWGGRAGLLLEAAA